MFNNNDSFEKEFELTHRMVKRGMKVAIVFWVGAMLLGATLIGAAIYVAVHFLSKVW